MKNIISLFFFLSIAYFLMPARSFAQIANFSYTQTCFGNQTTLVASSTLPDTSISSWKWDLDGNGSYELSGKTIIALFTTTTIPVKLKITPKTGAADSITNNVIVDPLPQVNFMVNNLCQGLPATYISQSTIISPGTINQFLWDFNNDGATDDNTNDTVSFICGPAQTYITKLTCVSNKGCSAFAQKTTTVYPIPTANFNTSNTCFQDNTTFTNTSTVANPDFYIWNFGDGTGVVSAGNGNSSHMYSLAGNYNTQLIVVSQAGCKDMIASAITIHPKPAVTLHYSNSDSSFFSGGNITLTVVGGSYNYAWSTGAAIDSIVVAQAGSYTCQVTDAYNCSVQLSASVKEKAIPDTVALASGTILTPNDDNINDVLMIENIATYANCDLTIYNIWNEEMYSVKGYKNDWKGTNKSGSALPAGAYYYIIKCDDKAIQKGNINILR